MQFKTRRREEPAVEITPLIDVVFLLLLFFMVTTQFVSLPGIKLTLPGIEPGAAVTATSKIELHVTAAGDMYVNGQPTAEAHLDQALTEAAPDVESAVVVLLADEFVPHGKVVGLMDRLRRNGLKRVVLGARWERPGAEPQER